MERYRGDVVPTATSALVWVARIVLASVFGFAGAMKLRDADSAAQGARELDVPERFVFLVGRALPLVELSIAVSVLVPPLSAVSAAIGLVVLVAFTVAILRVLSVGRTPMCFCFGARRALPADRSAVVRNVALVALCLVVMVSP